MDAELEFAIQKLEKGINQSLDLRKDLPTIINELRDILEAKEAADIMERAKEDEASEEDNRKLEERLCNAGNEFADAIQLMVDKVPDARLKSVLRSFSERVKLDQKFNRDSKSLEMLATLSLTDS